MRRMCEISKQHPELAGVEFQKELNRPIQFYSIVLDASPALPIIWHLCRAARSHQVKEGEYKKLNGCRVVE